MFRTLRLQLALQFIFISVVAYVLALAAGSVLFYRVLENNIRSELREHLYAIRPLIDLSAPTPRWKDGPPAAFPSLVVQIFDSSQKLIQQVGNGGSGELYEAHHDLITKDRKLCSLSLPLLGEHDVKGYLQIQTDIKRIDSGLQGWMTATLAVTLLFLAGLIFAGILVSFRAVRPVEEASSELRRFMADAGHELATPLAIIQAHVDTMAVRVGSENVSFLEIISRTVERMGALISDLRLLATTDLTSKRLEVVLLPLDELVEDVVEEFSALFRARNVNLNLGHVDRCMVNGNPADLQRLLANLLKNALTYTDPGGSVEVELRLIGKKAKLIVTDSGIGIPPDCLDYVFARFYRVDSSRARATGGTGLGLCIIQKIAKDHGGQVGVSSKLGKGSTFLVWLPAAGKVK